MFTMILALKMCQLASQHVNDPALFMKYCLDHERAHLAYNVPVCCFAGETGAYCVYTDGSIARQLKDAQDKLHTAIYDERFSKTKVCGE